MNIQPILIDLFSILNKICQLKEAGTDVIHETCSTDLSFVWRDNQTGRVIETVKLSRIKTLAFYGKTDPRIKHLIAFAGGYDPLVTRDAINKLNALKAFW